MKDWHIDSIAICILILMFAAGVGFTMWVFHLLWWPLALIPLSIVGWAVLRIMEVRKG